MLVGMKLLAQWGVRWTGSYKGFQLIGILALYSLPSRCYNIVAYMLLHIIAGFPSELRSALALLHVS